jgi:hypothetical protein
VSGGGSAVAGTPAVAATAAVAGTAVVALDAGAGDAAEVPLAPEEIKARAGKQANFTGGARPAIATEPFASALAKGASKLVDFVDPGHAVILAVRRPGAQDRPVPDRISALCPGKDLAKLQAELTAAGKWSEDDASWTCANTSGGPTCWLAEPAEYGAVYNLGFAPDATRGLRLISIIETEVGEVEHATAPFLAKAAAAVAVARTCP